MAIESARNLAVLIDGDNVSPKSVNGLLADIARLGTASVKRIYGDWTRPDLGPWKPCLLEHSIQPIQQFAYTTGKNATDGIMIIDAMDLLYTNRFSGFCLVSSDSDFTRLAARLREQGVAVFGFGERKTPRPFVTACDRFVYFDTLDPLFAPKPAAPAASPKPAAPAQAAALAMAVAPPKPAAAPAKPAAAPQPAKAGLDRSVRELLAAAVAASVDEGGRANLGRVGYYLSKQTPAFAARDYGFKRLSDLVAASGVVAVERLSGKAGPVTVRLVGAAAKSACASAKSA
jgi:hypothetical protein